MGPPGERSRRDGPHERRHSLGKYVKRFRAVLRRGSTSSEQVPAAAPTSTEETIEPAVSTTAAEPKPRPVTSTTGQVSYPRSTIQQERARALFAKYGLTLESHEWVAARPVNETVQRVEKPIRMRVRRQCHCCNAAFGVDRVCVRCEHVRCKRCPRYPAKKAKSKGKCKVDETAGPAAPAAAATVTTTTPATRIASGTDKKQEYLTIKSRSGGPDLERRPPRQRVRRRCHKCQTLFIPVTVTVCTHCQHSRCTKCPRDPSKRKKWPDGYPGDVVGSDTETETDAAAHSVGLHRPERMWRKPRMRIRWTCDRCNSLFVEKAKTCGDCGHERCPGCVRDPPQKAKKDPDPVIVRAVEERLTRLRIREPPTSAEMAA